MQYYIYTDAICPSNNAYFEADKGTGNNPKNSFAIYLFHVIIIFLMHKTLCLPITVMILLTYTTAIIGSIAIAKILRIAKLQVIIGETY